jgi:hypothetical protein
MFRLFCFALAVLDSLFKSKSRLEAENAVLRHQLIVLRRKVQGEGPAGEQRPLVLYPALSQVSAADLSLRLADWKHKFTPILGGLHRHYVRG